MNTWKELSEIFVVEEEADDSINYVLTDDVVVLVPSQRDGTTMLRATYAQVITDEDGTFLVIQLEGEPEDPLNRDLVNGDCELKSRIYCAKD